MKSQERIELYLRFGRAIRDGAEAINRTKTFQYATGFVAALETVLGLKDEPPGLDDVDGIEERVAKAIREAFDDN